MMEEESNTIRPLRKEECRDASAFVAETGKWTWGKYLRGSYPKEALDADIRRYSADKLRQEMGKPGFFGFVSISHGSEITGLVLGEIHNKSGFAELRWITVDPEHQHEGIGIRLMTRVEEHLQRKGVHKVSIFALPALQPAVKLYMKFGLLPEAFLKQQWWGVDFLQMSKWIGKYRAKK